LYGARRRKANGARGSGSVRISSSDPFLTFATARVRAKNARKQSSAEGVDYVKPVARR
jgi:hypothetical protein